MFFKSTKEKNEIAKIIITSKLYSVSRIAQVAGISVDRVIRHIQDIIADANKSVWEGGNAEWKILRGAQLDLNKMEIIIDENIEKTNPTIGGLFDKAKKVIHSKLADQVSQEQQSWICPYCRTTNVGEEIVCNNCNASRSE